MSKTTVAILMGSKSDLDLMRPAIEMFEQLEIGCEVRVLSAHRTPERTAEFARSARQAGFKTIICAAGGAAHLAGAVAAQTTLPVIGVPLARTPLQGLDALYATVQMPQGMPVATVAVDGSANAALLAAQIIGVADESVARRLDKYRESLTAKVTAADESLSDELGKK